jgi:hypothetical protein
MQLQYCTFIPYVNERALLDQALHSIQALWPSVVVVDNSPLSEKGLTGLPVSVYRPPVPLTFSQTQNLFQQIAYEKNADFFFFMHADAEAQGEAAAKFVEYASAQADKNWGLIYTHYDAFCCFNTKATRQVGYWDWRLFPWYYADCDYYLRIRRQGFEILQSDLKVLHHNEGSNSMKHDPYLKQLNNWYMERTHIWYQYKWGGVPGREIFDVPFNGAFKELL